MGRLDYYKILKHVASDFNILFFVMLLFKYLNYLPEFWNMTYVFFGVVVANTVFIASKIKRIPESKRKESKMIYYFSHLFLLSLIVIVINQFIKNQFIIDFIPVLSAISIALGFLAFYAYKNEVEEEVEEEKISEDRAEKIRLDEFVNKFPRLNRIWGLRRFVRWMHKEGWWYSVGLILIVAVGLILRIWNLSNIYLNVDESIIGLAIRGIYKTGLPIMPSGYLYFRGFLSTYLMSLGTLLFGVNEFGLRILPILFGAGTIILSYFIFKNLFTKQNSIIFAFIIATLNIQIAFSRWARMYVFLQFFIFLSILFLIYFMKKREKKFFFLLLLSILFAVFSHRIGNLSIVLLFIPLTIFIRKKKYSLRRKMFFVVAALLFIILIFRNYLLIYVEKYIFGFNAYYDPLSIFENVLSSFGIFSESINFLFIILFILGFIFALLNTKIKPSIKILIIIASFIFPVAIDLLIYSQGFLHRTRYIYPFIPLMLLVSMSSFSYIKKIFNKRVYVAFIILILALLFISSSTTIIPKNYYDIENRVEVTNNNTDNLRLFLKENDDVITIASPADTFALYYRSPDYWMVSHKGEISLYSQNSSYFYTTSKILQNLDEFKNLEKDNIIVLIEKDRWRFIDLDLRNYLRSTLTYNPELSNGQVSAYLNF